MPPPVRSPEAQAAYDKKIAYRAVEAMFEETLKHEDCEWEQVGRCVYCNDHGIRLYQGTIPKDHAKRYVRGRQRNPATDVMRQRWGKED
jgi:hypothetical protein